MTEPKARIVLAGEDRSGAAFASVSRNIAGLKARAEGLALPFRNLVGVVALIGPALAAISLKGVINLADQIGKLSERSGISVQNLSALRFAGELADVSMDELGDSLKKLNVNIAAAARGEKEQAGAFKAIGVAVTDSAGKVRSADEVFGDIAERFSSYADGANKVALANAVGGKSFEKLIPLLNGGKEGLDASRKELEKLGGVFTPELAKKAQEFNDNLTRLGFAAESLKIKVAGGLIDNLAQLSQEMVKGVSTSGAFGQAMTNLLDLLSGRAQRQVVFGRDTLFAPGSVNQAEEDVKRIRGAISSLESDIARNPGNIRARENLARFQADLATAEKQINTVNAREAVYAAGKRRPANEGGGRLLKPDAPALPNSGAGGKDPKDEALASLRAVTDGRIKLLQAGLAEERDVYAFQEQFLRQVYDKADISLEQFYAAQDATRRTALVATRAAVAAEIAEREKLLASPLLQGTDKAADRDKVRNDIADARAKLGAAEREFDQANTTSIVERQRTRAALGDSVAALNAQISQLSGNSGAQDLLDIATQVRDARAILQQGGGDPAQADRLGALLESQRQLNIARDNFGTFTRRAAEEEERFLIAANARGDGQVETERGIYAIRQQALQQLGYMVRKQEELAASAGPDSPAVQFARELRLEFERLSASVDPALQRMRAVGDEVADALGKAAGAISLNFKDAKSAVKSLGDSLLQISTRELVTQPLTDIFRKEIRGLTEGGGSLAGTFGKIFGVGGQGAAPGAAPGGFSLAGVFGGGDPATTVPGFAGGQIDLSKIGADLTGLGKAATGSADILGQLPQLAGVPATVALGNLAGAAQIAANALLGIGAGGKAGAAPGGAGGLLGSLINGKGIGNLFGSSFGVENLTGGGFGSGTGFGLQDLGQFFNRGGYTGNAGETVPVGVVEGQEFVFSAPAVRRLGVGALDKLHNAAKSGSVPRFQQGGYVGMPAPARPATPATQAQGGGSSYFDLRGLQVQSNGAMDRMAEERSAQRIARTAERYLSRRGA